MAHSFDPLLGFGLPPPDAVTDEDALSVAIGHELFEGNADIPRVDDANPWKNPDGSQKMTPRPEAAVEVAGETLDFDAMEQMILDQAMAERDNSRSYQAKMLQINDAEAQRKRKQEMGEL